MNDTDLAEIAGHQVQTMVARYTHATGASLHVARDVIG